MNDDLIYLDTYVLQQDMRVRMPKSIIENLHVVKGKSKFAIYYDKVNRNLVMKVCDEAKNINGNVEK